MSSSTLRHLKEACCQQAQQDGGQGRQLAKQPATSFFAARPGGGGDGAHSSRGAQPHDSSMMFNDLGRDHVLTMIAVSLTYFKVSSRRVVDCVPLQVTACGPHTCLRAGWWAACRCRCA